jgi:hypothetical protein
MLPPIPVPADYDISETNGFLPHELPLERLADPYYKPWEAVVGNLQALMLSRRLRQVTQKLPVLSTARLHHKEEWQRAYVCLAFMTHGYMWGGDTPEEVNESMHLHLPTLTGGPEDTSTNFYTFPRSLRASRTAASRDIRRCLPVELEDHIPGRAD